MVGQLFRGYRKLETLYASVQYNAHDILPNDLYKRDLKKRDVNKRE